MLNFIPLTKESIELESLFDITKYIFFIIKIIHYIWLTLYFSLLMCDREESRPSEWFFRKLLKPVSYFFPTAVTAPTEIVAKAMINNIITPSDNNTELFENRAIHFMAGNIKKCPRRRSDLPQTDNFNEL